MDDEWERSLVVSKREMIATFFSLLFNIGVFIAHSLENCARNKHVAICAGAEGRWGALVCTQCPAVISFCSMICYMCACIHEGRLVFCSQCCRGLLLAFRWHFVSCGLVVLDARELLMRVCVRVCARSIFNGPAFKIFEIDALFSTTPTPAPVYLKS